MVEESSRSSDPAVSSGLGFLRLVSVGILAWCLDLGHSDFGFSGFSCSRVSWRKPVSQFVPEGLFTSEMRPV